jgi:hypothetical protein
MNRDQSVLSVAGLFSIISLILILFGNKDIQLLGFCLWGTTIGILIGGFVCAIWEI